VWGGAEGEEDEEEDEGPHRVAARTGVKIGLADDAGAEILEGLKEGEEVITVGQSHLRDGARVRTAAEVEAARAKPEEGTG
jgi:multidrug efflux pump subunit AcrA (membrane-fusion protein)